MNRLVFRLEPQLPGIEDKYRQHYLKQDIRLVIAGIFLWIFPFVVFTFIDRRYFLDNPLFFELLVFRSLYVLFSLSIIYLLARITEDYRQFDQLALLWSVFSVGCNMFLFLTRPHDILAGLLIDLIAVVSFYVFISNPIHVRIVAPLLYTAFIVAGVLFYKSGVTLELQQATIYSLLITNLIGLIFSSRLYTGRRLEYLARIEEGRIRAELQHLASTDSLTGVLNRRRLLEMAGEEFYRFQRYGRPFSILVMDLDGFKNVNDTFGHHRGDTVLIEFSERISQVKRDADSLGRMGGDEFCLVLPETLAGSASSMAGRILQNCAEISQVDGGQIVPVTVSIGISQVQPEDTSLDSLFARADRALYQAKNKGRNCWYIE